MPFQRNALVRFGKSTWPNWPTVPPPEGYPTVPTGQDAAFGTPDLPAPNYKGPLPDPRDTARIISGQLQLTTTDPGGSDISAGLKFNSIGEMYATGSAVVLANSRYAAPFRFDASGALHVNSTGPAVYWQAGFPFDANGALVVTSTPGTGYVQGWPLSSSGVAVAGLAPPFQSAGDLTTSAIPSSGTAPTFTRATTAYVQDNIGILRLAASGEIRFKGSRKVQNIFTSNTENWTGAGWTPTSMTRVYGAVGPTGANNATTLTATGAAASLYYQMFIPSTIMKMVTSLWLRRKTGTGKVTFITPGNGEQDITNALSSTWKRFSQLTFAGTNSTRYFGIFIYTSGDEVEGTMAQWEDITGQSSNAPSEYVSVGVLATPYKGSGKDGVQNYNTVNGNTVLANYIKYSQDFDDASWTKNQSTITANTTVAPDGTTTADTYTDNAVSSGHWVVGGVGTDSTGAIFSSSLIFSVYVKQGTLPWVQIILVMNSVNNWANFNLATGAIGNFGGVGGAARITQTLANGWYRISISVPVSGSGLNNVSINSINADTASPSPSYVGSGQTMFLWGAQIEDGISTNAYIRTLSSGYVSLVENSGASIIAATMEGYLSEGQSTNLCLQSETLADVLWSSTNVVISSNAQLGPNAVNNADTITDTATNAIHRHIQTLSMVNGTTYTASVYVKSGSLPWMCLQVNDGATNRYANFNLTTGAVGITSGILSTKVETLANGWFRFSTTSVNASGGGYVSLVCLQTDQVNPVGAGYAGSSQAMYVWGVQVEAQAFASSYIPTVGATVTRNMDLLAYNMAGNIDATLGSIYAEGNTFVPITDTNARGLVTFEAAGSYPIAMNTGKLSNNDGTALVTTVGAVTPNSLFKAASRWGAGGATSRGICLNGVSPVTGTFDGTMNGTTIQLGNWSGTSNGAFNGTIKNVKFYAQALTNAEMQALTA